MGRRPTARAARLGEQSASGRDIGGGDDLGTLIRFAQLPGVPFQNENQRMVKVVFRGDELGSRCLLTYEHSVYFTQGSSPPHADSMSEEVIYFRRGSGFVQRDAEEAPARPGASVAIPRGQLHRVVNTGKDFMEHWLLGGALGETPTTASSPAYLNGTTLLTPGGESGLERLACRRMELEPGQAGEPECFATHESVYSVSGGCGVIQVSTPDGKYSWEYTIDGTTAFWLPAETRHTFRNAGDCQLSLVGFHAWVDPTP